MKPSPTSDGTGMAVMLIPDDETPLSDVGAQEVHEGEPAAYHCTLFYLGDRSDFTDNDALKFTRLAIEFFITVPQLHGKLGGFGRFSGAETDPLVALVSSPSVTRIHDEFERFMDTNGLVTTSEHGFTAHITLGYLATDENPPLARYDGGDVTFSKVWISDGQQNYTIPLLQEQKLTPEQEAELARMETQEKLLVFLARTEMKIGNQVKVNNPIDTDPDPSPNPGAAKLRRYWTRGKGAAKIRWGTDGDFMRCVNQLRKHVTDPKGLCNVYHVAATGHPPGKHGGEKSLESDVREAPITELGPELLAKLDLEALGYLGDEPEVKSQHDLVFYENRSTPKVVARGAEVEPQKSWGKQTRRRQATESEEATIARGDWVRVDHSDKKPTDSDYRRSKIRPQLGKKISDLISAIEEKMEVGSKNEGGVEDTLTPENPLTDRKDA